MVPIKKLRVSGFSNVATESTEPTGLRRWRLHGIRRSFRLLKTSSLTYKVRPKQPLYDRTITNPCLLYGDHGKIHTIPIHSGFTTQGVATVDGSEIPNNHLGMQKNLVNNGISATFPSTAATAGFLNHQQYDWQTGV